MNRITPNLITEEKRIAHILGNGGIILNPGVGIPHSFAVMRFFSDTLVIQTFAEIPVAPIREHRDNGSSYAALDQLAHGCKRCAGG